MRTLSTVKPMMLPTFSTFHRKLNMYCISDFNTTYQYEGHKVTGCTMLTEGNVFGSLHKFVSRRHGEHYITSTLVLITFQ